MTFLKHFCIKVIKINLKTSLVIRENQTNLNHSNSHAKTNRKCTMKK